MIDSFGVPIYGPFEHPQPRPIYIVHTAGTRPNYYNSWSKPYDSIGVAKSMAVRMLTQYQPYTLGDWTATIYKVDVISQSVDAVQTYNAWEI